MKSITEISGKIGMGLFTVLCVFTLAFSSCDKDDKNPRDFCSPNRVDDCVCTADYEPVCGCNGVTYSNACHAACVGIDVVHTGPCQ